MMTELKQTEYTTIEIGEGGDYGSVIGNIVFDKSKMLYAEIVSGTICDHEELANARAFLDEVDDAMSTETVNNVLNGCCDVEMLPDNFWSVVRQRDATIKQQSNTIKELETGKLINEECVGCCKVVDVAARLQEELDSTMVKLVDSRNHCGYLGTELESANNTIKEYKEAIRVERIDRAAEKKMINREFCKDLRKLNATIEELKDSNTNDLHELYNLDKDELDKKDKEIDVLNDRIINIALESQKLRMAIGVREDKLASDSEVLMKAVGIVRDDGIYPYGAINELADLLVDYLDAPEVLDCVAEDNTSCTVEMDIRCE